MVAEDVVSLRGASRSNPEKPGSPRPQPQFRELRLGPRDDRPPLIVIVGPTASGKTGLAVRLAKKINGEIISADSRAIYKYMDIGTAKPTVVEQDGIKHWGIDLVEPDERFTVADFQNYAKLAMKDIRSRGKTPILVGGSGLYIDSVIFDYKFTTDFDTERRDRLNSLTREELIDYCIKNNIELPKNGQNKRYLVRAIEKSGINNNNRDKIIGNCIVVGISTEKEELLKKIRKRADKMFSSDIVKETTRLAKHYSFDLESMKSNIYQIIWRMIQGEITESEAKELFITDDWHLARKQITWFKRNPFIKWLPLGEIENYLLKRLSGVI